MTPSGSRDPLLGPRCRRHDFLVPHAVPHAACCALPSQKRWTRRLLHLGSTTRAGHTAGPPAIAANFRVGCASHASDQKEKLLQKWCHRSFHGSFQVCLKLLVRSKTTSVLYHGVTTLQSYNVTRFSKKRHLGWHVIDWKENLLQDQYIRTFVIFYFMFA